MFKYFLFSQFYNLHMYNKSMPQLVIVLVYSIQASLKQRLGHTNVKARLNMNAVRGRGGGRGFNRGLRGGVRGQRGGGAPRGGSMARGGGDGITSRGRW